MDDALSNLHFPKTVDALIARGSPLRRFRWVLGRLSILVACVACGGTHSTISQVGCFAAIQLTAEDSVSGAPILHAIVSYHFLGDGAPSVGDNGVDTVSTLGSQHNIGADPGSYSIDIMSSGYADWTRTVTVPKKSDDCPQLVAVQARMVPSP